MIARFTFSRLLSWGTAAALVLGALVAWGPSHQAPSANDGQRLGPMGMADYTGQGEHGWLGRFIVDSRRPTWPASTVTWFYNPEGQPDALGTQAIVALIENAGRKWSGVCNVRFVFGGFTNRRPDINSSFGTIDRVNVIGWDLLTGNRSRFSGFANYWYAGNNAMQDSDVVFNTARIDGELDNAFNLAALATHEIGHMLGIAHSDVQQSVMFADPYNTYAFQSTLRGDDAAACVTLYGAPASATADRLLNWAEQSTGGALLPLGTASQRDPASGLVWRHYTQSNLFVGVLGDDILVLPVGSTAVQRVGQLGAVLPVVFGAGF